MRAQLLLLFLLSLAIPSCLEDSESETKVQNLKDEIYELKQQALEFRERSDEKIAEAEAKSDESNDALLEANKRIDALNSDLSQSKADIKDALQDTRKFHQIYVNQIKDCAVGEKSESVNADGKVYENAEIINITEEGIRIRHRNGTIALTEDTAPAGWKKYLLRWSLGESAPTPVLTSAKPAPESTPETPAPKPVKLTDPEKAVVIITGDKSSGTGFIIYNGTYYYLYTAAHVLSGNKKLTYKTKSGHELKRFSKLEIATDVDMARMRILDRVPAALRLPTKAGEASNGKEITAYGNSGGGSVITKAEGAIQGVGAESLEIDAQVIQGNSGGPVVLNGSNTVAGIITHALTPRGDVWSSGTRYAEVRRFAARLDRRIQWQKISIEGFLAEPEKIEKLNQVTRLLFALSALQPRPDGMRLSTTINGSSTAGSILMQNSKMRAVQALIKMNGELAKKKIKPDAGETKARYISFYRGILDAAARQTGELRTLSPFHKEIAKNLMQVRKDARAAMIKRLRSIGG